MRIVVTGSEGQLGRSLIAILSDHKILPVDLPRHDITRPRSIIQTITSFQPDLVIHGAALTQVDACETDPDTAYRVNALGTRNIALACQQVDAPMVYVSTNEVFDGTAAAPYLEFDEPHPVGTYGRSKLAGERYVRDLSRRFYIVRTAWLYAEGGNNFVEKIIKAARERSSLQVVADEISSPTYAPDLAEAIISLIQEAYYGIYHLTNAGICSRYDFAKRILELAGLSAMPIEPITSDQYQRICTPPLYTPIRNYCAAAAGIVLRPWEKALEDYFARRG